jgi:hypothetical protein
MSPHTFLQNALVAGSDGETHRSTKCHNCNKFGHFSSQCLDRGATEAVQFLQVEEPDDCVSNFTFFNVSGDEHPDIVLAQTGPNIIPSTWMLLDSQSAYSVFKDGKLLTNVRDSPRTLRVCTNRGTQTSTKIGTVRNFGNAWFDPNSLANILSMAEVGKVCQITMDTSQEEAAITVHRKDGSLMVFRECKSGLHFFTTPPPIWETTLTKLATLSLTACSSTLWPATNSPALAAKLERTEHARCSGTLDDRLNQSLRTLHKRTESGIA